MSNAFVVRAAAGVGKTTRVVEAIAKRRGGPVEIYVPTHALAEELAANLRVANPKLNVKVIAGRSHEGADGKPLCKKNKMAEQVARAGGEVFSSLCARKEGSGEERCQHYASCPYIAQFTTPADVTIYPHAYLPLSRTRLEPGVPEIVVIDEAFFLSCIDIFEIPLALLRAEFLGPTASRVCAEIERAFTQGLPLFTHLYSAEIEFDQCRTALKEVRQSAPRIRPKMAAKERHVALQRLRKTTEVTKLLEMVYREYHAMRPDSHGLKYCFDTQSIKVHRKNSILRIHDREGNEARVLIIDANADEQLIRQFIEVAEFITIQATRQAEVIQCRSTRCSTTSLVPKRNKDPKSKREAGKRKAELERFVAQVATQHARVLVVGPQAVTGNVRAKVKALINVPANVDLAHFNAIRGIDGWKDHDAVVVIGRNEPPISEVEAIARCVFLDDKVALRFAEQWTVEDRGYRLKKGQLGVEVIQHPDPRVQAVLEQLREGETQQAIDRLRLVHAEAPKRVYVLSNIVLDIDVDHLVTWDELVNGGGRIEQAWNTLNGVMPLRPAWLATQFPRLWKSVDAAKEDAARAFKECRFTNIFNIRNPPLFRHEYRPAVAKQRAWSKCLSSDVDPEVTRLGLEALLGFDVEMRVPKAPTAARQPRQRRPTKYSVPGVEPSLLSPEHVALRTSN